MTNTTTISARIQNYRDEARNAKSAYTRIRDAINADHTRTPDWKRQQIAEARTKLARTLEQLQNDERQYIANTTKELEASVFGIKPGQDILAYRDAQDRVRNIHWSNEDDALELYRQAERSNDATLKQALSERAVDAGWARVQTAYAADNPEQGAHIEALDAIQRFTSDTSNDIDTAIDYSMPMG